MISLVLGVCLRSLWAGRTVLFHSFSFSATPWLAVMELFFLCLDLLLLSFQEVRDEFFHKIVFKNFFWRNPMFGIETEHLAEEIAKQSVTQPLVSLGYVKLFG